MDRREPGSSVWHLHRSAIESSLAVGAYDEAWLEVRRAGRLKQKGEDHGREAEIRILVAEIRLKRLAAEHGEDMLRRLGGLFLPAQVDTGPPGALKEAMREAAEEIELLRAWAAMAATSREATRVELLHAEFLMLGREYQAGIAAVDALDLRPDTALAGRGYLLSGQAAVLLGSLDEAELRLRRAIACSDSSGHAGHSAAIRLRTDALFALAAVEVRRRHWRSAIARLQGALDIELHHSQVAEAVHSRLALAALYYREGLLPEAARAHAQAALSAGALGMHGEEMRALLELSRTECALGRHDEARESSLRAVALARARGTALAHGAVDALIEALCALALAHLLSDKDARAGRALSRAQGLAERAGACPQRHALIGLMSAQHALVCGRLDAAEAQAREAAAALENRCATGRFLGEVILLQGRWAEAVEQLRMAWTVSLGEGDVFEQAVTELALAKAILATAKEDRERDEARRLRQRAKMRLSSTGARIDLFGILRSAPVLLRTPAAIVTPPLRRSGRVAAAGKADGPQRWERLGIITRSPALHSELLHLARIAPTDLPVLIHGETGSGKERVAAALHQMSGRPGRFVVFNAGTGQNDLFEAELFGHRRGAFTGAHRDRPGLLAQAEGGTLFLDEVADLQAQGQAALLRFLDTGEARPVGSDEVHHVKTRIVAASLKSLRREVARGRFRQDLFFRLAGAEIHVPPLRSRPEDIAPLILHFARLRGLPLEEFESLLAEGLATRLLAYAWPGNVRQLNHWVDQFVALHRAGVPRGQMGSILEKTLTVQRVDRLAESPRSVLQGDWRPPAREELVRLISVHRGNIAAVARDLQTYRTHVYRLMRRMGVAKETGRQGEGGV